VTISAADIARAREHLGYTAARPASGLAFGYPILTEPQFLFEQQIQNLVPANEPKVIKILDVLDRIECKMIEVATAGAPAERAEDVTPNLDEPGWLEAEYKRWALRLADLLGCPLCPWAERFKEARNVGNIRVR
jgi:hypothetical protein